MRKNPRLQRLDSWLTRWHAEKDRRIETPRALGISVTSFLAKLDPTIDEVSHMGKLLKCHPCFRISAVYSLMSSSEIKHPGERYASHVRVGGRDFQVPGPAKVRKFLKWNLEMRESFKVPLSFESEMNFWEAIFSDTYSSWCLADVTVVEIEMRHAPEE